MDDTHEATEDVRLLSLEAENFHRLKIARVRFDEEAGFVPITSGGENGEGKTSLLLAFCALVGGDGAIRPDVIHEGADGGWVRGEFSNGVRIERRFTGDTPKGRLDVTLPGDTKPKKPQSYINEWLGEHTLDPMAVFQMSPKRLREVLLSLGTDPELPAKLDAINAEREQIVKERKPWNSQKQRAERMKRPVGERPEPVDVSGEMARLAELQAQERVRGDAFRATVKKREEVHDNYIKEMDAIREVERLQAELDAATQKRDALLVDGDQLKEEVGRLLEEAQALPDPSEQIEAVTQRISEADSVTEALAPWREYDQAQVDVREAKEQIKPLNERLADLDVEEADLLAGSGIPVKGIGFAEDGTPLLNGKSLDVASGRERMEMALDMGFAANNRLKIILLDEANDLSLSAMKAVNERAKEKRYLVLGCRLGIEGPGEIMVIDGVATNTKEAGEVGQG